MGRELHIVRCAYFPVIPAQAGIHLSGFAESQIHAGITDIDKQCVIKRKHVCSTWIPACAGMT